MRKFTEQEGEFVKQFAFTIVIVKLQKNSTGGFTVI